MHAHTHTHTYVDSEVLQASEVTQVLLQFVADLQSLRFRIFEKSPELLQTIQLTYTHTPLKSHTDSVLECSLCGTQ